MVGIDAHTGGPLGEIADIVQSIVTIVTTPIGTRVMRRRFGSMLFDLVDSPGTARGVLRLIAATADAIERWETRVVFLSATVSVGADGRATIHTALKIKRDGRPLDVPITIGGSR